MNETRPSTSDIDDALEQLCQSELGRSAIESIFQFLFQDDGLSLDFQNQEAVYLLLDYAWLRFPGSVRDKIQQLDELGKISLQKSEV